MRKPKTLATSLFTLTAAALLALGAAGPAAASPAAARAPAPADGVSSHLVTDAGVGYWTPERMRTAVPGDVLGKKAMERGAPVGPSAPVAKSAPSTIEAMAPKAAATVKKANASESPVPHIDKVFFTLAGTNYVCSGNSVSAGNKNTVSTAGHCLNEGPGAFATKFTFVPAYQNGSAPYGQWTAKSLHAPSQWAANGDSTYHTGFAVLSTLNGQSLSDVVGASGLQFNAARGLTYKAFGYPAAAPFNGATRKSCSGTAKNDPYNPQFNSQASRAT